MHSKYPSGKYRATGKKNSFCVQVGMERSYYIWKCDLWYLEHVGLRGGLSWLETQRLSFILTAGVLRGTWFQTDDGKSKRKIIGTSARVWITRGCALSLWKFTRREKSMPQITGFRVCLIDIRLIFGSWFMLVRVLTLIIYPVFSDVWFQSEAWHIPVPHIRSDRKSLGLRSTTTGTAQFSEQAAEREQVCVRKSQLFSEAAASPRAPRPIQRGSTSISDNDTRGPLEDDGSLAIYVRRISKTISKLRRRQVRRRPHWKCQMHWFSLL